MYRCNVCGVCSEPRAPRLIHVINRLVPYRTREGVHDMRTEIARELPVCRECKTQLDRGITLDVLKSEYQTGSSAVIQTQPSQQVAMKKVTPAVDKNGPARVGYTLFDDS